jgi:hypothetical protein
MKNMHQIRSSILLLVAAALLFPASQSRAALPGFPVATRGPEALRTEGDDPSYRIYREGYQAILEERWVDARKLMAEMLKRYPKSEYRDGAEYWLAYSWKQDDPAKAQAGYQRFIKEHPGSSYFGDAVADLHMLEIQSALAQAQMRLPEELQRIEQEMERLARAQALQMQQFQNSAAFTALMAGRRDTATYNAIYTIALDGRQPVPLRHIALTSLADFPDKDPARVFLSVATKDTNETVQRLAIELFAGSNLSRGDRSGHLIDMFRRFEQTTPRREGALSTTLYAIAAVGDDRATDFVAQVARSEKDPALRNDAVYYLSNIGTERARQALVKILRGE